MIADSEFKACLADELGWNVARTPKECLKGNRKIEPLTSVLLVRERKNGANAMAELTVVQDRLLRARLFPIA